VQEGRTALLGRRHRLVASIRKFFDERGYVEVETPALVRRPAVDAHLDPMEAGGGRYLITSPEIQMKRLVVEGMRRIYQIGHVYRAGESGAWHNPEFTMLEWYRGGAGYVDLMDETEALVRHVSAAAGRTFDAPFGRRPVRDVFLAEAGWDPSAGWDEDRFFLDLVEKVEPSLKDLPAVFLFDYPVEAAAMAAPKASDPTLCERFELYMSGIEIANGYTELGDAREQERRFHAANRAREALGKRAVPVDETFLEALRRGLPPCAGIALGVDRLVATLSGADGIGEVMAFTDDRL
jgi:lysyl-tRNA synthetase class 2